MTPLLMLIDYFKRKGIVERESIKYLAEKKRLEDVQLRYIEDTCYGYIPCLLNNVVLRYWIPNWLV